MAVLRKCFLFCISLVLVFFLPILVSAHPGRTDGDGGHTDHGSGEYHYHHGYPAHDQKHGNDVNDKWGTLTVFQIGYAPYGLNRISFRMLPASEHPHRADSGNAR